MYDILIESAEMTLEIEKSIVTEGVFGSIKDNIIKFKDWLVSLYNRFKAWISKKFTSISKVAKSEFNKVSFKDIYEVNKEKYAKTNVIAYPVELIKEVERLIDERPQTKDKEAVDKWKESVKEIKNKVNESEEGPITVEKMKIIGGDNFSTLEKNIKIYKKAMSKINDLTDSNGDPVIEKTTKSILKNLHILIGLATKINTEYLKFNNIIVNDKVAFVNKHSLTRVEFVKYNW